MKDERPDPHLVSQHFRYVEEHPDGSAATLADGVIWPDGAVSVHWRGKYPVTELWGSIADAQAVHCSDPGHVFIDSERH